MTKANKLLIEIQTIGVSKSQRQLNGLKTQIASLETPLERIRAKFAALQARMRLFAQSFSMWALGVMFFGMLIQRTFTNIATSGVKAFKDLTDSSSLLTQNLSKLEAGWTFLKWSIGNAIATALLPLTPAIMAIILAISEWINKNPELAGNLVMLGILVGGVTFLFGALFLGIKAVAQAFIWLFTTQPGLIFTGISIAVLSLLALYTILINDTISLKDKLVGAFTLISAAVFGVAIAFGAWPIAILAALLTMLGGLFLFWDEFARLLGRASIAWEIMVWEWRLSLTNALIDMLSKVVEFFDKIPIGAKMLMGIDVVSGALGFLKGGAGLISDEISRLQSALDTDAANNGSVMGDFTDRFSELFAPGFADMSEQMTTALTSALPASEDVTTDSSALTVEGDVVFNIDPAEGMVESAGDVMDQLYAEFARFT